MNVRHLVFVSATLVVALSSGCGSSSNRDGANTPDDVSSEANDGTNSDSSGSGKNTQPDTDTKEMPHGAKSTNDGNSAPEDYTLTDRDCIELAKHYVVVQKADQMAVLSPKLTSAQKDQAEKSITDAVTRLGENWENSCRSSLVGGVVDRNGLKCAMVAKTVKGFDECINGPAPAK
jgi:hypothetical protein